MKKLSEEEKNELVKYTKPLAQFLVFILPILSACLQYDLRNSFIPPHWMVFFAAVIGGGMGVIIEVIDRVYKMKVQDKYMEYQKKLDEYEDTIIEVKNTRDEAIVRREVAERDLMLNSMSYNESWITSNSTIDECNRMLDLLNKRKEVLEVGKEE